MKDFKEFLMQGNLVQLATAGGRGLDDLLDRLVLLGPLHQRVVRLDDQEEHHGGDDHERHQGGQEDADVDVDARDDDLAEVGLATDELLTEIRDLLKARN